MMKSPPMRRPRRGLLPPKGVAILTAVVLAGCSGAISGPDRYAGPDYDASVGPDKNALAPRRTLLETQFHDAYVAATDARDPETLRTYVLLGTTLSTAACTAWLDRLTQRAQYVDYGKQQGGILTVLATGILGLAGADADVFAAVALGAAAANSSADLYRDYRLLGEDSSAITDMVLRKMAAASTHIDGLTFTSFPMAYNALYSFSRLCEPAVIHQGVLDAIRSKKPTVDPYTQDLSEGIATTVRQTIGALYGKPVISEDQLLGLYWRYTIGEAKDDEPKVEALLAGLTLADPKEENTLKLKDALKPLPGAYQNQLKQRVEEKRKETKTEPPKAEAWSLQGGSSATQDKKEQKANPPQTLPPQTLRPQTIRPQSGGGSGLFTVQ